nr:coenzyme F420-0:L-glutamate ligase [Schumannella luteola]
MQIATVDGIGEVQPGTDLPALIADAVAEVIETGDILAVTSKIVSKAEGRLVAADDREQAITDQTVRLVASRRNPETGHVMRIVENPLGLVMAAAGVDASNVPEGTVLLLPEDPDASARAIAAAVLERSGVCIGVIVTDTMGRAWRVGQTDAAIGAAGLHVIDDLRGSTDANGRVLDVTVAAVADEIAAAADLVKGKASGRPVAIVRGLARLVPAAGANAGGVADRTDASADDVDTPDELPGAAALVRRGEGDLFRLGVEEARAEGYAAGWAAAFAGRSAGATGVGGSPGDESTGA